MKPKTRSAELIRAQHELRLAAMNHARAHDLKSLTEAEEQLFKKARAYARLAELVEGGK